MEKIDTKSILKELQKDPPKVIPDNKKKTISVTYDFGALGHIKRVKIIASREQWLNWQWVDAVSYEDIKNYLSRPSKEVKKALENLYKESKAAVAENDKRLDIFNQDFFDCVLYANAEANPLFKPRVNPRKPSQYGLTWSDKNEITATAIYLCVYLGHLNKSPQGQWPDYVFDFLEAYEIEPDLLSSTNTTDLIGVTENIISEYFGLNDEDGEPPLRFWQTFVTERPISIHKIKRSKRITPKENPFLYPLFEEFMKSQV